jgi:hypothetical protein
MNRHEVIREDRSGGIFRVHRSVFNSAEIAALEQANIFQRCWLYLGHDSEIPNVGDYRRRPGPSPIGIRFSAKIRKRRLEAGVSV